MKQINKILAGVLAACMLLTSVPINAVTVSENDESTDKTSEVIDIDSKSTESTETPETPSKTDIPVVINDEDELSTDNWSLDVVFYDSSVDNGKTPLTEINWDASDGSYEEGEPRVITVQINYKNTNAVTTYQPGDLSISIPNLIYSNKDIEDTAYDAQWSTSVVVGANDSAHTGYDWNFTTGTTPSYSQETYTFTNANTIEEKANFEGSIQIVYTITPRAEENSVIYTIERFDDECMHSYSTTLQATLNDIIESNEISFNYTRIYTHPWEYRTYTLTKTADKITSLDGLPAGDFYWVKYNFKISGNHNTAYPYIGSSDHNIIDTFPEECIVLDSSLNQLIPEGNVYTVNQGYWNGTSVTRFLYVGYPKSIYNNDNGNLLITNHAELYSKYDNSEEYTYVDESEVSINLSDFEFSYSGELYGITKTFKASDYSSIEMYYQSLIGTNTTLGNEGCPLSQIFPTAIYTGHPMDVKFGDDLLYITDQNSNYRKLEDEEYYFSKIYFPTIKNGNNVTIAKNKYNCELWVRHAEETEYVLYEEFKNTQKTLWRFTPEDKIVGYYFVVKEMTESLIATYREFQSTSQITINNAKEIAENGRVYNFAFIQVYIDGKLQNEPTIDSYSTFITKEEIANYDQETYGTYMQRNFSYVNYQKYIVPNPKYWLYVTKNMDNIVQDAFEEAFFGTSKISLDSYHKILDDSSVSEMLKNVNEISDDKKCVGWELFDLLPSGMEITSTEEEIINSIAVSVSNDYVKVYDTNGIQLSDTEFKKLIKENIQIKIVENWHSTGRSYLYVKIDLNNNPIFMFYDSDSNKPYLTFSYNFKISYDSFLENGNTYTNYVYSKFLDREFNSDFHMAPNSIYDELDLNDNGDTTEKLAYTSATTTITSVISTHQDVTKYVQTDQNNFTTGIADSSCNSEYTYKLRVRTGQNDITNLIIYDSIENYAKDQDGNIVPAYGKEEHWNGEFLGVDTSYAKSEGYNVKVYYSEEEKPGYLSEDSSWKEYLEPALVPDNDKAVTITSPNWPSNYPGQMTEEDNFWEQSFPGAESLEIKFDSTCKFEGANYDYLRFYDKNGNNITSSVCGISADKIGGTDMAGQTYTVEGDYVKITMRTDHSVTHKGFSATIAPLYYEGTDNSKVKSLAFEYLDDEGNPAILPANSLTYVLVKMKSPADESIKTLAYNGCWTQWNAIDEFGQPVDFITGINSNIVKVALPNSVKDEWIPMINLHFEKEIQGIDEAFSNMKLDKDATYKFQISLKNQETGDIITGILDSKEGLLVTNLPVGTYLITERDDIYFDFVEMYEEISIEGVTFEKTDEGYILTIDESITEDMTYNIKVINKIEPDRPYEDKEEKENFFKI